MYPHKFESRAPLADRSRLASRQERARLGSLRALSWDPLSRDGVRSTARSAGCRASAPGRRPTEAEAPISWLQGRQGRCPGLLKARLLLFGARCGTRPALGPELRLGLEEGLPIRATRGVRGRRRSYMRLIGSGEVRCGWRPQRRTANRQFGSRHPSRAWPTEL